MLVHFMWCMHVRKRTLIFLFVRVAYRAGMFKKGRFYLLVTAVTPFTINSNSAYSIHSVYHVNVINIITCGGSNLTQVRCQIQNRHAGSEAQYAPQYTIVRDQAASPGLQKALQSYRALDPH